MKLFSVSFFAVLLCCSFRLIAQGKNAGRPGKITADDFRLPASPVIDSNSNAVILSDIGVTEFTGNDKGWFSYLFKRKTRIKILNKKAFGLATVKIPRYEKDENKEVLKEATGSTYNLDNGELTETKMSKADVFSVRTGKNHIEDKFTLPAVKEGSIIEYTYSIQSDFIFNIPEWEFQNINYPCLWSEYQVTIPSLLIYVFQRSGVHPFFIDKADEGHTIYAVRQSDGGRGLATSDQTLSVNAGTIKHRWVIKDVPAFYVENFLSSPVNYLDKVSFQLHQTNNGETSTDVMPTWQKATEELLKRSDFASFMYEDQNDYWMEKPLSGIVKAGDDPLQQAKNIYYHIAGNFTCSNFYDRYINSTLQDVYRKRNGNVGEINLLVTAFLRKQHIEACPVLLSTREFGFNYPGYPVMDRLNYVICRAEVNGKVYFLDASHPNLGFGNLAGNCYNGHARVISRTDSASIYFLTDSLKEIKTTIVNIFNDEKNKGIMTGGFQTQLDKSDSYQLREEVAGTSQEKYLNDMKESFAGSAAITSISMDSLTQLEMPVKLKGDFILKNEDAEDIIYFNPLLWWGYKSNPFTAAVRKYPVEMLHPLNETYTLTVEIPAGYRVDEMPKMARVSYNGGEGSFEYMLQKSETLVQLRCSLRFKKSNFDPEDYNTLRDFFSYVVKKESEQIVFKKN